MSLKTYQSLRDFNKSTEPRGKKPTSRGKHSFVIQKHFASTLHYDFRLELEGTLKSWAVPKGPSMDPAVKRLAIQVEDHPLEYASFEGEIPKGEYGAGKVVIWDQGEWVPQKPPLKSFQAGKLEFELKGKKLKGSWVLVRSASKKKTKKEPQSWLLIKRKDAWARPQDEYSVTDRQPDSVVKELLPEPPERLAPQLAQLTSKPPEGSQWIHEVKWDGYRTLCRVHKGSVKLFSRNGHDWTARYKFLVPQILKLNLSSAWLDGEVAWMLESGAQSFDKLQRSFEFSDKSGLVYVLFDLLTLDGRDLRGLPIVDRKEALKSLLHEARASQLTYSEHWSQRGADLKKALCKLGMEGMVSKLSTAPYQSGRGSSWLKTKCYQSEEFVIGGFTYEKGTKSQIGALLLGAHTPHGFKYAGKVGTGFTQSSGAKLLKQLEKLAAKASPFELGAPPSQGVVWTLPQLVAQVRYSTQTSAGLIRHGAFLGIREDKSPKEVLMAKSTPEKSSRSKKKSSSGEVSLSHPGRVVYEELGYTKKDLFDYYTEVAELLLPHIKGRPLALLRCPEGAGGECFFQKHLTSLPPGVEQMKIDSEQKDKTESVLHVTQEKGVLALCQLNSIEFHPWGSTLKAIDRPNVIVMDLDPGEEVSWEDIKDGARQLKDLLENLELSSYVKLTGGSGLHVHIPIRQEFGFELVKPFAKALAKKLVKESPRKFTSQITKSKRRGRIFVDYLRNGYGATAVCAYSARARAQASVAMPITWSQLDSIQSPHELDIKEAPRWIKKRKSDPWKSYFAKPQSLRNILNTDNGLKELSP